MQKKLLAAAVLSALAGGVSAQSANVTLYGTLQGSFEFASATGADGTAAAPAGSASSTRTGALGLAYSANPASQSTRTRMNPAGSNFGLRGSEDLGNGMSAWFQIEIATTLGAPPPNAGVNHGNAPSFRNTAVGLRSNTWGSIGFGSWDTPFNLIAVSTAQANGRSGAASTGFQANLLGATTFGYGAWSAQNAANACLAAAGGGANAGCFNYGTNFDRRERGGLMWWSPNWNGFEARVHYHATMDGNAVTADNRVNGGPALKPNIWSMSLAYTNGPLAVGYAYDRQNDILAYGVNLAGGYAATGVGTGAFTLAGGAGAAAANMSGSKGTGHRLGGKYAFNLGGGSSIGVSAMWESLKWTMNYTNQAAAAVDLSELKKTAWRLQGNFTTGKHFFGLEYTRANELKGSIAGGNGFNGGGTDARGIILSYNYMMSKRTSLTAYYTDVNNSTNANYSGIVFGGIATAAGADPKYYGLYVRHAF
ncbi:MAG: porin [Burkholderiales bacterium]|nr:porin [Burkholderiales bacterium]